MARGLGETTQEATTVSRTRSSARRKTTLQEARPDIAACLVVEKSGFAADQIGALSNTPATFRCSVCRQERVCAVETAVRAKDGTRCRSCAPRKPKTRRASLAQDVPVLARELVAGPNGESAKELSSGSAKLCQWRCRRCGNEMQATVESRVRHYRNGRHTCGRCSAIANGSLLQRFPDLAAELVREEDLDPAYLAPASTRECRWRCSTCSLEWTASPKSRTSKGVECPACQEKRWTTERLRRVLGERREELEGFSRMSRTQREQFMTSLGVMTSYDEARAVANDFIEGDITRRDLLAWDEHKIPAAVRRSLAAYDRYLLRPGKEYIPRKVRQACYERDEYACRACGVDDELLAVDHVVPEAWGGRATLENTQTLCRTCNSYKGDRPLTLNIIRRRCLEEGRPVRVYPNLMEEWNQVEAFRSYGVEPECILTREELWAMFPDAEQQGMAKSQDGPFSGLDGLAEHMATKESRQAFTDRLREVHPGDDPTWESTIEYINSDNPVNWPLLGATMLFFTRVPKKRKPLTAAEREFFPELA